MKNDPKKFDWNYVGLDFENWEEEKLWALDLPVSTIDIAELVWHFDCPFWEHDNGERYTVTPWDVIGGVVGTKKEQQKVSIADTSYPIDIYFNKNKWLILDGIHRLVKLYKQEAEKVEVRIVPKEMFPLIQSDEPIELPSW
jgi:hypothetical protein